MQPREPKPWATSLPLPWNWAGLRRTSRPSLRGDTPTTHSPIGTGASSEAQGRIKEVTTLRSKSATPYRSVDLLSAIANGWAAEHQLSPTEVRIVAFIAQRGTPKAPGVAVAWFALAGMDAWAKSLHKVSRPSFYRALASLEARGIVRDVVGAGPMKGSPGKGLSTEAWEEVREWAKRSPWTESTHGNTTQNTHESTTETTAKHTTPRGPEVSGMRRKSLKNETEKSQERDLDIPSDLGFCPPIERRRKEEKGREGNSGAGAPPVSRQEDLSPMDYDDDWDRPSDDDGYLDIRDTPKPGARRQAPTTRLAQKFYDRWTKLRARRPRTAPAWSSKAAFLANLKKMLKEYDESDLEEMIEAFFDLVDAGEVRTNANELWKDLINNKGKVWKRVQSSREYKSAGGDADVIQLRGWQRPDAVLRSQPTPRPTEPGPEVRVRASRRKSTLEAIREQATPEDAAAVVAQASEAARSERVSRARNR